MSIYSGKCFVTYVSHVLYWCETCTVQEFLFSYVYVTTMVELYDMFYEAVAYHIS